VDAQTYKNIVMVENNSKPFALKSREYYRKVSSINFTPLKVRDFSDKLVHRKGDIMTKKRLFRKPKVITISEDLYNFCGELVNAKNYAKCFCAIRFCEERNIFYYPAEVEINLIGGGKNTLKFDTNDEARECIRDLKEKCSKCGNELL
jgi:hypothetical protein